MSQCPECGTTASIDRTMAHDHCRQTIFPRTTAKIEHRQFHSLDKIKEDVAFRRKWGRTVRLRI